MMKAKLFAKLWKVGEVL